jgi:hypothetical protein
MEHSGAAVFLLHVALGQLHPCFSLGALLFPLAQNRDSPKTPEGVKKLGLCLVALSGGVSLRNFRKRVVYVRGNLSW